MEGRNGGEMKKEIGVSLLPGLGKAALRSSNAGGFTLLHSFDWVSGCQPIRSKV